ncbi:MAG: hypothetical protein RR054_03705 [Clostridia bacterium]
MKKISKKMIASIGIVLVLVIAIAVYAFVYFAPEAIIIRALEEAPSNVTVKITAKAVDLITVTTTTKILIQGESITIEESVGDVKSYVITENGKYYSVNKVLGKYEKKEIKYEDAKNEAMEAMAKKGSFANSDFKKVENGKYKFANNEALKKFTGLDDYTFTELYLYVDGLDLSKIEGIAKYDVLGMEISGSVTIEFSDVGSTKITLPQIK